MSYNAILDGEIAVKQPVKQSLMQKIKDNFDYLYSTIAGATGVSFPNGDFEMDSDESGVPDNWAISLFPGGSQSLDTAAPGSGSKCLKFVHPGGTGNGGGYAKSDYIPYAGAGWVTMLIKATAAMKNKVTAYWYGKDKAVISSTVLDERTNTPTNWTPLICSLNSPPAGAKYVRIELVGGDTSVNVAGSAYFDAVQFTPWAPTFHLPYSLSQASISTTDWANITGQQITIPLLANQLTSYIEIRIEVTYERYSSSGYNAYTRLRIDTTYGPTSGPFTNTSYETDTLTIDAGQGGQKTLYIQGRRDTGGNLYVRKTSTLIRAVPMAQ